MTKEKNCWKIKMFSKISLVTQQKLGSSWLQKDFDRTKEENSSFDWNFFHDQSVFARMKKKESAYSSSVNVEDENSPDV